MFKWGKAESPLCDCNFEQKMEQILNNCINRKFVGGLAELNKCTDEAKKWLTDLDLQI